MARSTTRSAPRRLTKHTVFIAVLSLSVFCLILFCGFAVWGNGSAAHTQVMDVLSTCWKMGFGGVLGMLGTRSAG